MGGGDATISSVLPDQFLSVICRLSSPEGYVAIQIESDYMMALHSFPPKIIFEKSTFIFVSCFDPFSSTLAGFIDLV